MLLSVANSRPRNLESSRVSSLFPGSVQESSKTLVQFVEKYYDYLNTVGLPSNEIANITSAKDIDIVSNRYLTEIQSLIARNIPNSITLDKVTLYKIILQYYRTRGSEDSIHSFFKIFFNEFVSIFYPRDYLFDLSGGSGSWVPIIPSRLNTTNTNPNKDQIEIVSDGVIGPRTGSKGTNTVTLQSYSKFVWTLDGREPREDDSVPHLQKNNVSGFWEYTYGSLVITSTNSTTWPDEAVWDNFSRNIEFTNLNSTKNIEFTKLDIIPIESTTETISLVDEVDDDILTTETNEELALEQFFTPEGTLDLTVSGITSEEGVTDYITIEDDTIVDLDDAVIVTEDAYASLYELVTTNIEYVHKFSVTALPLYSNSIDNLVNSLETEGFDTVYRCSELNPTIWVNISADTRIWRYSNSKSFASDRYKLHDGKYWQKYSYQIKTSLPYDTWSYDYLRFVHPAGLKLFNAIMFELFAKTDWTQYIDYKSPASPTDYMWLVDYKPPVLGYHTPTYQPGWLNTRNRILKFNIVVMREDLTPVLSSFITEDDTYSINSENEFMFVTESNFTNSAYKTYCSVNII
jgi:hypothetical protein